MTTKRIAMTKPAVLALAFLLLVAVVPPGGASAAGSPPPGGYLEHVRYHVKVLNDSDKCLWLTPYWSTPAGSFSIMSGGPRAGGPSFDAGRL